MIMCSEVTQPDFEIRELRHRFSNDLQMIAALLRAQARTTKSSEAAEELNEAADRIVAFTEIDASLESFRSGAINPRMLLTRLARGLQSALIGPRPIELKVDACETLVSSRVGMTLGLITNELVINAIKYAFPDGRPGTVHISCEPDGSFLRLSVEDNGIGTSEEIVPGLGLRLVRTLALESGGTIERRPAKGVRWEVRLRLAPPENGERACPQ